MSRACAQVMVVVSVRTVSLWLTMPWDEMCQVAAMATTSRLIASLCEWLILGRLRLWFLLRRQEAQGEGAELQLPHISAALSSHDWRPLQSRFFPSHHRYNLAPKLL